MVLLRLLGLIWVLLEILFSRDRYVTAASVQAQLACELFGASAQCEWNWQVVSTLLAGAAGGALCGGPLADRIGRKMALAGNSLFLITGALLSASATSLNYMLLGRLIAGIGIGVSSGVVPLYISEVATFSSSIEWNSTTKCCSSNRLCVSNLSNCTNSMELLETLH